MPVPGPARGSGFGLGFRGTAEIVDNGFISAINNSVGVGIGLDWLYYRESSLRCERAAGSEVCADLDPDLSLSYVYVPVVMQWNFWLSRNWSVFGEPGIGLHFVSRGDDRVFLDPFLLFAGGRYHFGDNLSLTLRAGYPTLSVGLSMLL